MANPVTLQATAKHTATVNIPFFIDFNCRIVDRAFFIYRPSWKDNSSATDELNDF